MIDPSVGTSELLLEFTPKRQPLIQKKLLPIPTPGERRFQFGNLRLGYEILLIDPARNRLLTFTKVLALALWGCLDWYGVIAGTQNFIPLGFKHCGLRVAGDRRQNVT